MSFTAAGAVWDFHPASRFWNSEAIVTQPVAPLCWQKLQDAWKRPVKYDYIKNALFAARNAVYGHPFALFYFVNGDGNIF